MQGKRGKKTKSERNTQASEKCNWGTKADLVAANKNDLEKRGVKSDSN